MGDKCSLYSVIKISLIDRKGNLQEIPMSRYFHVHMYADFCSKYQYNITYIGLKERHPSSDMFLGVHANRDLRIKPAYMNLW